MVEQVEQAAKQAHFEFDHNQELGRNQEEADMEKFWRQRPDRMAVKQDKRIIYIIEFKRTMDLRPSFQANAEARATRQHKWLAQTLAKVGARSDWKVQVIIFTGGTLGSVEIERFENNLKLLTSKRKNGPISESYMPEHFWRPTMRSYEHTICLPRPKNTS